MCNFFHQLSEYCYGRFINMNLLVSKPQAAWYIFIDFKNYKDRFFSRNIITSNDLVNSLIEGIGLVTISGDNFGYDKLTVRYSFVDVNISFPIQFNQIIYPIKLALDKLEVLLVNI